MAEQPLHDSAEEDKPAPRSDIEVGDTHVDGNIGGSFILGRQQKQGTEINQNIEGSAIHGSAVAAESIKNSFNTINTVIQGYGELLTRYDTNVRSFLEYYLGTDEQPVPFGGREKDLEALDRWFFEAQAPHYALLAAPAGRGKSALLCQWIARLSRREDAPHIIFFPVSIRFETNLESVAFAALAARAGYLFGEKVAQTADVRQYRGLFADFLRRPHPDGKPVLVILDGLDEAAGWKLGLDIFPPHAPEHLKVLIAARPLAGDPGPEGWLNRLGWSGAKKAYRVPLDLLTREGVRDVLARMGNPLDALAAKFDVVETLYYLSEGDPLVIRLYVDALLENKEQAALLGTDDLHKIQPGLEGYFQLWLEEQQRLWGAKAPLKEERVGAFLDLCAAALGPLSNDDLLALAPDQFRNRFILDEAARDVNRFVIGDGKETGYVFSHPRLRDYFNENMADAEREGFQERFLQYGKNTLRALQTGKLTPKKAPSYVLQHYVAHLREAQAPAEAFYELICQPWAQAWLELDGTYAGFLNDIGCAWGIAEEKDAFGIQFLCALCFSSIASQSKNISGDLLALAVKEGVLSIRQGLILIEQQYDFSEGLDKLSILTEELTDDQLREGFELALNMGGWMPLSAPMLIAESESDIDQDSLKPRDLTPLIPHQTWELAESNLKGKNIRVQILTLTGLYIYTKNRVYFDSLIKRIISYEDEGWYSLIDLIPHLSSELLSQVIEIAQNLQDEARRIEALTALVPYLSEPLRKGILQQALEDAQNIQDEMSRIQTLFGFGHRFPSELLGDVLEIVQNIQNTVIRAQVLTAFAPHLPSELLGQVLEMAQTLQHETRRAQVLTELAPHLPSELLGQVLEMAQTLQDETSRAQVLTALVPYLSEPLRQATLQQALEMAQSIPYDSDRAQVLTALAPHLPSELLVQALEMAKNLRNESKRAEALTALTPHLPSELLSQVIEIAQNLQKESKRAEVLAALVPYLSEPLRQATLQQALDAAQNLQDEINRAQALTKLAPHLPSELLGQVLEMAQTLQDETRRAQVLTALAPHLPSELLRQALEGAQTLQDETRRAEVLTALVPYLSEPLRQATLQQALEMAQSIPYEYNRAQVLTGLVPYLSEPLRQATLQQALKVARNLQFENNDRIKALSRLVLCVSKELQIQFIDEMLDFSEGSFAQDVKSINDVLFSLNNQTALPPDFKSKCIRRTLHQAAKLPRNDILDLSPGIYKLICSTLPEAEHKPLAEQFALAILQVGEWWP